MQNGFCRVHGGENTTPKTPNGVADQKGNAEDAGSVWKSNHDVHSRSLGSSVTAWRDSVETILVQVALVLGLAAFLVPAACLLGDLLLWLKSGQDGGIFRGIGWATIGELLVAANVDLSAVYSPTDWIGVAEMIVWLLERPWPLAAILSSAVIGYIGSRVGDTETSC